MFMGVCCRWAAGRVCEERGSKVSEGTENTLNTEKEMGKCDR